MRNSSAAWIGIAVLIIICGCASVIHYENVRKLESNEEYDGKLQVKQLTPLPNPSASVSPSASASAAAGSPSPLVPPVAAATSKKLPEKKISGKKAKKQSAKKPLKVKGMLVKEEPGPRQPDLEDSAGFAGRRPIKDPFRVGEEVDLAITYLRMTAGHLKIKVMPFVEVNGEKAYHFQIRAKTNEFFSKFYATDDYADTYLNYQTLLPYNMETHVRESKQLKEIRSFIDHDKLKADYWEKKVTKEHGEESKKLQWDILPYTQNVISAAFYARVFQMIPGQTFKFRLTDEGKNMVFRGHVLRKEKLSTAIGEFNTIVIKPDFEIEGVFKPVGEIYMWLTDDDRRMIIRIESAIRIGTLVGKLHSITPGVEEPPAP